MKNLIFASAITSLAFEKSEYSSPKIAGTSLQSFLISLCQFARPSSELFKKLGKLVRCLSIKPIFSVVSPKSVYFVSIPFLSSVIIQRDSAVVSNNCGQYQPSTETSWCELRKLSTLEAKSAWCLFVMSTLLTLCRKKFSGKILRAVLHLKRLKVNCLFMYGQLVLELE